MVGDPSRLSDAERQILVLLGEGHTAKSIAGLTGLSVNAVNERLRLTRRKTGVGSSRELARMLRDRRHEAPQENRHEQIGMAGDAGEGQAPDPAPAPDRAGGTIAKGTIVMTVLAIAAAAFIAGQHQPSASPVAPSPRVVATSPAPDARIAPGPFMIRVTFDQQMRPGSYSFVTTGIAPYPDCERAPQQSADHRTFTLRCMAKAGQRYSIGFNYGRFHNFVSLKGDVPAQPAVLDFAVR